jgi:hypothetical protein
MKARTDIVFEKPRFPLPREQSLVMTPQRMDNQTMYIVPDQMPGGEFVNSRDSSSSRLGPSGLTYT